MLQIHVRKVLVCILSSESQCCMVVGRHGTRLSLDDFSKDWYLHWFLLVFVDCLCIPKVPLGYKIQDLGTPSGVDVMLYQLVSSY